MAWIIIKIRTSFTVPSKEAKARIIRTLGIVVYMHAIPYSILSSSISVRFE
jgi:hypothetical protein